MCADQLYLADYNCSSRVVDESRDIVFRHGHTRVVPLFVTTHEHFGIQLNLFDLFDSRITRRACGHRPSLPARGRCNKV